MALSIGVIELMLSSISFAIIDAIKRGFFLDDYLYVSLTFFKTGGKWTLLTFVINLLMPVLKQEALSQKESSTTTYDTKNPKFRTAQVLNLLPHIFHNDRTESSRSIQTIDLSYETHIKLADRGLFTNTIVGADKSTDDVI